MKHQDHDDGSTTFRGGGWFWARFRANGTLIEMAPNMEKKPAHRLFLKQCRERLKERSEQRASLWVDDEDTRDEKNWI
jgi:hypothetical protein